MNVILTEEKMISLMLNEIINEYNISDGNADRNPYKKKIDANIESIKKLIYNDGQLMLDISNVKKYMVYEILSFANITGKRFGICQLMKDDGPYGTIMFKPMVTFKPIY